MVQQQQEVFSALKTLYELDIGKSIREESDTKARAATPYGESGASVPLHRTGPGSPSAPMIIRERTSPNYYSHSRSRPRSHSYGRYDSNIDQVDPDLTFYDDVLVKAELSSSDSLAKIPSTDRGGYRTLLLAEALQHTRQAGDEYQYLRMLATRLERRNRDMLDTTKFRQENAIYAFTIVTIVFLPLSAVASIFGMNTSDIRDMDGGQWIYWATAVPVTAVTVLLGLLWTGELSNLGAWLGEALLRLAGRKGGVNKGIAEKGGRWRLWFGEGTGSGLRERETMMTGITNHNVSFLDGTNTGPRVLGIIKEIYNLKVRTRNKIMKAP
ncbi:hypothetical protein QBC37DRAFT_35864 [Rhypophila decipiens]|uniref:Uncharacterized protein n=1 Tax=Rhypophila decipiens TaxID=261697 RepID=A0AAN6Y2Y8_9PEZI|nr:hypothetical protein QBC37DRAFT_35864 [Rhypophila decipiens]